MTAIEKIRKSTGQPALDVIRTHASQGMSKQLTADTLGISKGALNRICNRFGIEFKRQTEMVDMCKSRGRTGQNMLKFRQPVLYNGIVYWPSDPTNMMIYEKHDKNERRKFTKAAVLYLTGYCSGVE